MTEPYTSSASTASTCEAISRLKKIHYRNTSKQHLYGKCTREYSRYSRKQQWRARWASDKW